MCLDELQALHKHTTRTTTRVVDLSTIRLYELSHQLNNSLRGIKFPLSFTLSDGEFREKVLIDSSHQVTISSGECVNLVNTVK